MYTQDNTFAYWSYYKLTLLLGCYPYFHVQLWDEIKIQLPKMQCKCDIMVTNGTKILEFSKIQICPELCFRIELGT